MKTIGERSSDTARSNDYLFGAGVDEPLAKRTADGSIRYYLVDGLNSVVALASATGQISSTSTYDEWGNTSGTDFLGYAGREAARLPGTTLWFDRARYYRPEWGRFLSEDPFQTLLQPADVYRYAGNTPTTRRDPSGLQAQAAEAVAFIGGTLVIGAILYNTLNNIDPGSIAFPIKPPIGVYPPFKPPKPTPNPADYKTKLPNACDYPQLPGPQVTPPKTPADQCVAVCTLAANAPDGPIKNKATAACWLCLFQQLTGLGDPNSFKPPNGPWNKP
jgi:RHS repeat-associated protein